MSNRDPLTLSLLLEGLDSAIALESDPLTFRKQLAYAGQFEAKGKRFRLSNEQFTVWARNHELMRSRGVKVPLPVKHTTDPEKNRGEVLSLELGKDSKGRDALFFVGRFRDAEAAKLSATAGVSLYAVPKFKDGLGNEYTNVITHVALTDYPVLPDMEKWQIAASLDSDFTTPVRSKRMSKTNPVIVKALRENREMKLATLEAKGYSPAVLNALKLSFCTDEEIALSLSHGDEEEDADAPAPRNPAEYFDEMVKALSLQDPLALSADGKSKTGPQDENLVGLDNGGKKQLSPMQKAVAKKCGAK